MKENYCEWHFLSQQNCEDGPEICLIRYFREFPEGSLYAPIPRLVISSYRTRRKLAPRKS